MLTAPLKQTPEYKRLLAGMAGAKPAVVALFGMPPTARAQMLAALCEDTGRSALVVCAGEADATRFAEDAANCQWLSCKLRMMQMLNRGITTVDI